MTGVSAFALWRGGWPERTVALGNLAAWAASTVAFDQLSPTTDPWALLAVDLCFLALLLYVALTSDRYWPLFAAAFHLLGVVVHIAILVDHVIRALAYMHGLAIWSYLVLIALAVGAAAQNRRRALTRQR